MANAQKLFLAYGHTLVSTLIPAADGSIITDSVGGGWTRSSAAFDGTTVQSGAASAAAQGDAAVTNGATVYIGKDWGATQAHRVTKVILYGPSDNSLLRGGGSTTTVLIEGSQDGSAWTTLDSFVTSGGNGQTLTRTTATLTATTAYRYHRVSTTGNGSSGATIAELQFFRDL